METTFIDIGDFHSAPGPRNPGRFQVLDEVIAFGLALPNLGAWLWPGDLSHARQAIADKNLLFDRLQTMADRAPVLIVRGNHDLPGDLYGFSKIRATHPVYVVEDEPLCLRFRTATGHNVTAACLPYPEKAGLAAVGVAPSDVVDAAGDALEAIFIGFEAELAAAAADGDLTILVGHVNVGGSITSVGQPNIGKEIELAPRHLERLGPIYIGLNHIHKHQVVHGAVYPGSLCRLDWGEIHEKGFVIVEAGRVDAHAAPSAQRWQHRWRFQPVNVPPMYHVEGLLTRDGFTWTTTAGPGGEVLAPPASWRGCEVRVRYRFAQSEKSVLSEARVLAEFAEAARLEVEPIAVPDRALRAPAVVQAQTLADKVAAWADVAGVTTSEAVLAKLARLEHEDPTALLASVQAWLTEQEAEKASEVAA